MLVPAPKEDIKALIGDKSADEMSDLSEAGSDYEDINNNMNSLEPTNVRIHNQNIISGKNNIGLIDELIEQTSLISTSSLTENEPIFMETKNEFVFGNDGLNDMENPKLNLNTGNMSLIENEAVNIDVTSNLSQNKINKIPHQTSTENIEELIIDPPNDFVDDAAPTEQNTSVGGNLSNTEPFQGAANPTTLQNSNISNKIFFTNLNDKNFNKQAENFEEIKIQSNQENPEINTSRKHSAIEFLAAVALGPVLALTTSEISENIMNVSENNFCSNNNQQLLLQSENNSQKLELSNSIKTQDIVNTNSQNQTNFASLELNNIISSEISYKVSVSNQEEITDTVNNLMKISEIVKTDFENINENEGSSLVQESSVQEKHPTNTVKFIVNIQKDLIPECKLPELTTSKSQNETNENKNTNGQITTLNNKIKLNRKDNIRTETMETDIKLESIEMKQILNELITQAVEISEENALCRCQEYVKISTEISKDYKTESAEVDEILDELIKQITSFKTLQENESICTETTNPIIIIESFEANQILDELIEQAAQNIAVSDSQEDVNTSTKALNENDNTTKSMNSEINTDSIEIDQILDELIWKVTEDSEDFVPFENQDHFKMSTEILTKDKIESNIVIQIIDELLMHVCQEHLKVSTEILANNKTELNDIYQGLDELKDQAMKISETAQKESQSRNQDGIAISYDNTIKNNSTSIETTKSDIKNETFEMNQILDELVTHVTEIFQENVLFENQKNNEIDSIKVNQIVNELVKDATENYLVIEKNDSFKNQNYVSMLPEIINENKNISTESTKSKIEIKFIEVSEILDELLLQATKTTLSENQKNDKMSNETLNDEVEATEINQILNELIEQAIVIFQNENHLCKVCKSSEQENSSKDDIQSDKQDFQLDNFSEDIKDKDDIKRNEETDQEQIPASECGEHVLIDLTNLSSEKCNLPKDTNDYIAKSILVELFYAAVVLVTQNENSIESIEKTEMTGLDEDYVSTEKQIKLSKDNDFLELNNLKITKHLMKPQNSDESIKFYLLILSIIIQDIL